MQKSGFFKSRELNFQYVDPLVESGTLSKERKIGEWSLDNDVKISVFWTLSCNELEIRK